MKTINDFQNIYVTADLHLSKDRLNRSIQLRGFSDPKEHTIYIRNMINNISKSSSDILYVVGDIGFKDDDESLIDFCKSITPRVKVVYGNHDSQKQLNRLWKLGVFEDFKHEFVFRWRGNIFHLHHLPLLEWDGFFDDGYLAHGHTHGSIPPYLRAMDIGLDANNIKILNLEKVVEQRKEFHNIDENRNRIKLV